MAPPKTDAGRTGSSVSLTNPTTERRWIKDRIKRTFPKNDKEFLSEAWRLLDIVMKLVLYQSRPRQIPAPDMLRSLLQRLQDSIVGASFRDTRQVALRNQTMREISAAFDKIFSYLESVASEADFAAFRLDGLTIVNPGGRKRARPSPPSETPEDAVYS